MDDKLMDLVKQLERIAKKNKDEFRYHIGIRPLRDGGAEFSFICTETADQHTFLAGYGSSIDEAISDAQKSIADSVKDWGYKS